MCLLRCWPNTTGTNYKVSIERQAQHETLKIHKSGTPDRQNNNNNDNKAQFNAIVV
jgi:hypothetical protein